MNLQIASLVIMLKSTLVMVYMTLTCRFNFPSILLVYHISIPIILDLTHFIGLAGRHSLFCRSTSLFGDPTSFCSFTGAEPAFSLYSLICLQLSNKITSLLHRQYYYVLCRYHCRSCVPLCIYIHQHRMDLSHPNGILESLVSYPCQEF